MKIITQPTVYLVGKQVVQQPELSWFLADHDFADWSTDSPSDAETLVEVAARNCYMSFKGGRPHKEHIEHILEVGHGSVCEHAVWNFIVVGVSRSLSHELIRHRAGVGVSQLSQRYVDESAAEYVEPDVIAADPELHAVWLEAVEHAHAAYVKLAGMLTAKLSRTCKSCNGYGHHHRNDSLTVEQVRQLDAAWICGECDGRLPVPSLFLPPESSATDRRKAARQAARSVLPNATETKLFLTINARALRNIIEQRASAGAEPEIRKLANALLDVAVQDSPTLFGDYKRHELPDGTFAVSTDHPKV